MTLAFTPSNAPATPGAKPLTWAELMKPDESPTVDEMKDPFELAQ
jgi:hypothetical protein